MSTIARAAAFVLGLMIPITANANPDTDYPHRDWGKVATLGMSISEGTACIARELARQYGSTLPLPVDGGTDIDAGPGPGLIGQPYEPWLRFKVRGDQDASKMRVFYRHPVSRKQVYKLVGKLQDRCLKVRSIVAANE